MALLARTARDLIEQQFAERNAVCGSFFAHEAERLAQVCAKMSDRFLQGGRLLAFGSGAAASDAQHIAVEFVHPVLVGKRALPALDLSSAYPLALPALLRPEDIVVGFGPPGGDPGVAGALRAAAGQGALTLSLPGSHGDYAVETTSADPFIHQELVEILYHALWETVHVFFEHERVNGEAGRAGFLYPFLGDGPRDTGSILADVAASIRSKVGCDERLREQVAAEQSDAIGAAVVAMHERVAGGGSVLCFGNGGSATDATDLALDLLASPKGYAPVPALSLAAEPATLTAIANDIGREAIFLRQVIAHGRSRDVAVAISTSGGSSSVVAALTGARAQGLLTIALVGYDGGEILRQRLADHVIVVPSDYVPRVQEIQASIYHVMLDLLQELRLAA